MSYDCTISASLAAHLEIATRVDVPVHTLCPCSREISKVSAHNQRGTVAITVGMTKFIWIEDIIEIAEASASSPVYALLKREDEKHITERAYENPRFVEDVVREVALRLEALPGLRCYTVEVENFESIHNHSAYAVISRRGREVAETGRGAAAHPQGQGIPAVRVRWQAIPRPPPGRGPGDPRPPRRSRCHGDEERPVRGPGLLPSLAVRGAPAEGSCPGLSRATAEFRLFASEARALAAVSGLLGVSLAASGLHDPGRRSCPVPAAPRGALEAVASRGMPRRSGRR